MGRFLANHCLGLFRFSLCETKERTRKRGTEQLARTRDTPRAKKYNRALSTFVERRTQRIIRSAGLGSAQPRVRRHTASTDAPRRLVFRAPRRRTLIVRLLLPVVIVVVVLAPGQDRRRPRHEC